MRYAIDEGPARVYPAFAGAKGLQEVVVTMMEKLGIGMIAIPASGGAAAPSEAVRAELAPGGVLRTAINLGNAVLAAMDEATGEPRGVSVDLARELARRLGARLELVTYSGAGKVVEAIKSAAWDLAFMAVDPARAAEIDFTPPYLIIEGAYLVKKDSALKDNSEVDRPGIRVATATGSAYDLFLSRELKKATVVRYPGPLVVVDGFVADGLEVAAGVKQMLESEARRLPDLRLLPGRFMAIRQTMALPKGKTAGLRYVGAFLEEQKASGFVAKALARHGIEGAAVAPPAGAEGD
jgi:polar amino acid transport system substrate-binding protein